MHCCHRCAKGPVGGLQGSPGRLAMPREWSVARCVCVCFYLGPHSMPDVLGACTLSLPINPTTVLRTGPGHYSHVTDEQDEAQRLKGWSRVAQERT